MKIFTTCTSAPVPNMMVTAVMSMSATSNSCRSCSAASMRKAEWYFKRIVFTISPYKRRNARMAPATKEKKVNLI